MELSRVLFVTDLSEASFLACAPARKLADERGSRICVLHVVSLPAMAHSGAPLAPAMAPLDIERLIQSATEELERLCDKYGFGEDVERLVLPGEGVAETVCRHATENEIDLIVLSTHGRTGFRHLVLGSVAESILRHTSVPTLVFPRR